MKNFRFSSLLCCSRPRLLRLQRRHSKSSSKTDTTQTIEFDKIKEITFSTDGENPADAYIGQFTGKNTVVVGGNFTYAADNVTFDIAEGADNTLTVNIPEYVLTNTVMVDLTLGAHTISGLTYDEATGAYVRDYGNDGLLNEIWVAPMEHIWEMTLIVIIFVALGAYTLWAGLKKR